MFILCEKIDAHKNVSPIFCVRQIDLTEKCGETYDYEIYDVSETTYNCDLKPVGRICSYFGDIVPYISDSSPATAIIIPILVIGLVIVIVFTAIACKRRQQQQQLGLTRNLSPTTTQPQPQQTHVVVYHHVVPPQQGGGDFSSNPQQPLMSGRGQQIEIHQYPPNPQQMPLQGYGQQMTTGQFYPPNPSKQDDDKRSYGPPPSYEEAAKNLV
ncbi:hypothetical protein KUTeg_021218 [Tegillarca granosa]|uniref:Uncharacterized protein n=1 Tax=Tegillarca granosa TaxID=220873 RepID=A0ABQ9EEG3_TEGGR|nr:hypothetical protein KUTeg_021218 [Tegillarca granosa]